MNFTILSDNKHTEEQFQYFKYSYEAHFPMTTKKWPL